MIATWMAYAMALAAAAGLLAYALEYLISYAGRSTRWVWACALLVSFWAPFVVPIVALSPSLEGASTLASTALANPEIGAAAAVASVPDSAVPIDWGRVLDLSLIGMWVIASLAMIGMLLLSTISMARAKARWRAAEVAGERIYLSGRTGPGVVGFLRSSIVIPEWVLDWDEQRQRLIVLHEREHATAKDPFLLFLACLSLAVVPWNLAMWWQLRRLRLAVEVDCDRRVLGRSGDVRGYGELLLEVGQRASRSWYAVAAFSEPRSFLERRIRRIILGRAKMTKRHGLLIGAILLGTPIGLLATPIPQGSPLERLRLFGTFAGAPEEPSTAVLWIDSDDKYRIGSPTSRPVAEQDLEGRFRELRASSGEITFNLFEGSTGYAFLMARGAACNAGFTRLITSANFAPQGSVSVPGRIYRAEFALDPGTCSSGSQGVDTARQVGREISNVSSTSLRTEVAATATVDEPAYASAAVSGQQQQQARDTVYRMGDLDRNPELRNGQAMPPIMERLYPRELQDLGLGGSVLLEFVIGRDGVADSTTIRVLETPWANLGEASVYAVKAFRFQPGMIDNQPVRVLIQMPITWRPRDPSSQP